MDTTNNHEFHCLRCDKEYLTYEDEYDYGQCLDCWYGHKD